MAIPSPPRSVEPFQIVKVQRRGPSAWSRVVSKLLSLRAARGDVLEHPKATTRARKRTSAPSSKVKACTVSVKHVPNSGQGQDSQHNGGKSPLNATVSVGSAGVSVGVDAGGGGVGGVQVGIKGGSCFPALDFKMPYEVPGSLDGWWCSQRQEYAFLGFSYDTSSCPSAETIRNDFQRMRSEYKSRYVRIYSVCDRAGFQDDLIDAAWDTGLGLHLLLWFGFEGTDEWKSRKKTILQAVQGNPRAPYVVRAVVVGSEPLYDWALDPDNLAKQIYSFRSELEPWTNRGDTGMLVTLSDLAYGFQLHGDAPQVFEAVDVSEANVLPFLDPKGTTGDKSFPLVKRDVEYFQDRNAGKKVYLTQTGWPSNDALFKPNSPSAVASVAQEQRYFEMLSDSCGYLKAQNQGGVGWFAHTWSDATFPGWGILDDDGQPKFRFAPRTSC